MQNLGFVGMERVEERRKITEREISLIADEIVQARHGREDEGGSSGEQTVLVDKEQNDLLWADKK